MSIATLQTPLIEQAFQYFTPRPQIGSAEWIRKYVVMPNGRHFDPAAYPHVIAPGGPCDAYDDPLCRRIALMWASRLGKTAICHSLLEYQAHTAPCPMLFGTSTRDLATQIVDTKIYKMLELCEALSHELKPAHRRKQTRVDLLACRIFVAWSGSATTLADISAKIAHANEVDKWDSDASSEADPLELFFERCKEFPNRKELTEGTPTIKRHSRIERALLAGTNRRYHVPCPHCGAYRQWKMGSGDPEDGGIVWDRIDKRSDPDLTRKTARYVCEACHKDIWSHQRAEACRNGVWVPEGCTADGYGKLVGEPARSSINESYQLSSLYALSLSWGDIAAKFVNCKGNPRELQNFINSWLGETWEVTSGTIEPNEMIERLCGSRHVGMVPADVAFLTAGVDVQQDRFVWSVYGWGPEARGYLIDYGECSEFDELVDLILLRSFASEDNLPSMTVSLTLIDSGYDTDAVYDFCRKQLEAGRNILPSKGASNLTDVSYRIAPIDQDGLRKGTQRRIQRGLQLVHVATNYWQFVVQRMLETLRPGDSGSLSLPDEVRNDQDFIEQLLNEALVSKDDSKNYTKQQWQRIHETIPNDFRDVLRYARCAAEIFCRQMWVRVRARAQDSPAPARVTERRTPAARPDGRPWI